MQRNNLIYALTPLIVTTICLVVAFVLFFGNVTDSTGALAQDIDDNSLASNDGRAVEVTENGGDAVSVTVQSTSQDQPFYLNLLGTVEAESEAMVFAAASGQIANVPVREGMTVNKGDVLFVIDGVNGTTHPNISQYDIAKAGLNAAINGYYSTADSMESAVKSSELQLQSAKNQAEASYLDYQLMGQSIGTGKDGIGLIRSTLSETRMNSEREMNDMQDKIDDLQDSIFDLEDLEDETIRDLEEQIDNAPNEATRLALEERMDTVYDDFNAQSDKLDEAFKELNSGYLAMKSGAILAENQIIGQLEQAESQEEALHFNRDSLELKLGLSNGTSDPVRLAEQGVKGAKAQANSALAAAEAQLELAQINYDMAAEQRQNLVVRAPISGKVGSINVSVGDIAGPSSPLTQILGDNAYLLKVGVDSKNASYINSTTLAEVKLADRYVSVPIESVSPLADPMSKLVTVTVRLPKIAIKPNQTMSIRFAVTPTVQNGAGTIFVPLDAVTIGTDEQFIYIEENGKARKTVVETGEINGEIIEIVSGLNSGERVIIDGAKNIQDGQFVTVK